MEEIKIFLANNYIWFMIASGVLLVALIGCLIDLKRKKNSQNTEVLETLTLNEEVEQLDTPSKEEKVETLTENK